HRPQFIVFQCGADSLRGDPLAHLRLTPAAHAHAARSLCDFADETCDGRLMAFGGGGYDLGNLAAGWCAVLRETPGSARARPHRPRAARASNEGGDIPVAPSSSFPTYCLQILKITPVPGICSSGPLPAPTKCVSAPLSRTTP